MIPENPFATVSVEQISQQLNASPDDPLVVKGVRLLYQTLAEVSGWFGVRNGSGLDVRAQMANYGLKWIQLTFTADHRVDGFYLYKNLSEELAFVSYPRTTTDPGKTVEVEYQRFDIPFAGLRQD